MHWKALDRRGGERGDGVPISGGKKGEVRVEERENKPSVLEGALAGRHLLHSANIAEHSQVLGSGKVGVGEIGLTQ